VSRIEFDVPVNAVRQAVAKRLRVAAIGAAVALAAPAVAQSGGQGPVVSLSIPAQSVQTALVQLADQAGVQIVMPGSMGTQELTPGLNGEWPLTQALDQLLRNTGFGYQLSGSTLTITALTEAAPVTTTTPIASKSNSVESDSVDAGIEEVVVTAQGREQRLQDVPISVAVASGEMLDAQGTRTLEEMASRMPNVKISNYPGTSAINIRGVGSGNNLGFEQAVATFVDGVYRGRARAVRMAFFDVDRIEVLRGPQTTFFGNNAIAGALNIITRKPSQQNEANASVLYGSHDEYSVEGGITRALTDDIAIRVAARASGMDGYVRNDLLDEDGPSLDHRIGRVAVAWTPTDRLSFDARVDVGRMRDEAINNAELRNCPADSAYGSPAGACARHIAASGGASIDDDIDYHTLIGPSYFDMNLTEVSVRGAYEFDRHRLSWNTGWYDHDYTNYLNVMPTLASSVTSNPYGLPTRQIENFHQFSQEVRIQSTGDGRVEYMFGAYFADSELDVSNATGFYFAPLGSFLPGGTATTPIAAFVLNSQDTQVWSAFASANIHVTDDARVNLGLRYSIVEKDASREAIAGIGSPGLSSGAFIPAPAEAQAGLLVRTGTDMGEYDDPRRKDKKLMPAIAFEYDLTDRVMGYVSYSKGFKAGGYSVAASKAEFEPETVDAYEAGIKSSFFDRRLILNAAAFYSKYNDLQESVISVENGVVVNSVANVAKSIAKGIELSAQWRATPALSFTFEGSWLSSEYDSYESAPCTSLQQIATPVGCRQDLSGKDRAFAPELSGILGAQYSHPIGESLELTAGASLFYSDEFFTQATNDELSRQGSYALLDARLALAPIEHNWEVALIGKNLTDRETISYWSPLPSSLGSGQVLVDRSRSVALQLSLRF
jgi:outer membrane receptor protein involved in Fe transport